MRLFCIGFGYLEANEGVAMFVRCVICQGAEVLGLGGKIF